MEPQKVLFISIRITFGYMRVILFSSLLLYFFFTFFVFSRFYLLYSSRLLRKQSITLKEFLFFFRQGVIILI